MKILNRWKIERIPEEERENVEEGTEKKTIGKKIAIGAAITAAVIGGVALLRGGKHSNEVLELGEADYVESDASEEIEDCAE